MASRRTRPRQGPHEARALVRDEEHETFIRALWDSPGFSDLRYTVLHHDGSVSEWRGLEGPGARRVKVWPGGGLYWSKKGEWHRDCFFGHRALPAIDRFDRDVEWYCEGVFMASIYENRRLIRRGRGSSIDSVTEEEFERVLTNIPCCTVSTVQQTYTEQFK
jgi:hypothetical protein